MSDANAVEAGTTLYAKFVQARYEVTVSARYSDGRELSVERTIEVFESEEESKSSSNWFVSAWHWIYNTIIKNVANFFISVWNGICEMFNWQDATGNYLDDIE